MTPCRGSPLTGAPVPEKKSSRHAGDSALQRACYQAETIVRLAGKDAARRPDALKTGEEQAARVVENKGKQRDPASADGTGADAR